MRMIRRRVENILLESTKDIESAFKIVFQEKCVLYGQMKDVARIKSGYCEFINSLAQKKKLFSCLFSANLRNCHKKRSYLASFFIVFKQLAQTLRLPFLPFISTSTF